MKRIFLVTGLCLVGAACKNTDPDPIVVPPTVAKTTAGFDSNTAATVNVAWQPQNTSTNATSYKWQWGDGTSSTGQAPSHTYTVVGKMRLLLSATGVSGTDTISKVIQVAVDPLTASITGLYKGKLYKSPYGFLSYTPTKRDTTIAIIAPAAQTVSVFGRTATYYSSTYSWEGHKPLRANYTFTDLNASFSSTFRIQKEQNGDSIYIYRSNGGLGGGDEYRFYGKK